MRTTTMRTILAMSAVLPLAAVALELVSPANGTTVPLLTDAQKHYLSLPRQERAKYFSDDPKVKKPAFKHYGTLPRPVSLEWKTAEGDSGAVNVTVVRKPDGKVFFSGTVSGTNAVDVWNLEIAREWEWTVKTSAGSVKGQFRTEDQAPRFMSVGGVGNFRDLGGRIGLDGRRVKQGLILRSKGLNANAKYEKEKGKGELGRILVPPTKRGEDRITPEGRRYLLEDIGVKTDIDLRNEYECFGMNGSPLGPTVTWEHHSLTGAYAIIKGKWPRASLPNIFRIFLEKQNYPIVLHCIGGADRTGCVAFLLNALLGVSEEELYKDWEVTAMVNSFRKGGLADEKHWKLFNHLVDCFNAYPGETLRERAENGIKSLGFTDDDIAAFRAIMLEESR